MKKLQKNKTTKIKVKVKVANKTDAKFHKNKDLNKVLLFLKKAAKSEKASFTKKQKKSFANRIATQATP